MKRTFLVDVDLDGSTDITGTADDILATLTEHGINALAVRPWKSSADVGTVGGVQAPLIIKQTPPTQPPILPPNFNT